MQISKLSDATTIRLAKKIRDYQNDIILFVREQMKAEPDHWQREALLAAQLNQTKRFYLALKACAGPGKSCLLAWLGCWFLTTKGEKGNHPKGVAISVTWENLKDNLWAEMSKWINTSELCTYFLKWTKTRIYAKDHPETWFLSARAYSRNADSREQGKVLSGVHSKYVLFLIDESGEIPVSIAQTAKQALSTEDLVWAAVCQAGNPTSKDGMLYDAVTSNQWHCVTITGDPDDPKRSKRISKTWAMEEIASKGRDDPWVMAYILGEFPPGGINTLLSDREVGIAQNRKIQPMHYQSAQKRLGIDVAREGLDSTIIFPRQGLQAFNYIEMKKGKSHDVAARIILAKSKWRSEMEMIDACGGWGCGVVDSLIQAGTTPQDIHASSEAINKKKYFNRRAEMWFNMAEWVQRGGALPPCRILKKELSSIKYSFKKGRFIMEEKAQLKSRLGYSPDRADALAFTFAIPELPKKDLFDSLTGQNKNFVSEYDPLDRNLGGKEYAVPNRHHRI